MESASNGIDPVARLALEIARCAEVHRACNDGTHPCNAVVNVQAKATGFRQVPEAWVGNLREARILIVSSNPSISEPPSPETGEDYPLAGWDDTSKAHPLWPSDNDRLLRFQTERLAQGSSVPLVNRRAQFLCMDGKYRGNDKPASINASQRYWNAAFKQAQSLFGDQFDLSNDICLTEVVHCKSKGEEGVPSAAPRCADRYLLRVLECSTAPLVIIGGAPARRLLADVGPSWAANHAVTFDVSEQFGHLGGKTVRAADHVGLLRMQERSAILVACQQLSYGSNRHRFVESVIGPSAAQRLQVALRSKVLPKFTSRDDVIEYLGLA